MPTGKKKGNGKMKKKISKVINGFMVAAASVTTVGGVLTTVPVQAAEPTNQSRNSSFLMLKMQKVASLSTTHLKTNMQLHLKQ